MVPRPNETMATIRRTPRVFAGLSGSLERGCWRYGGRKNRIGETNISHRPETNEKARKGKGIFSIAVRPMELMNLPSLYSKDAE